MDIISFQKTLSGNVSKKVESDIICRLRKIETYYCVDLDNVEIDELEKLKKHLKDDANFINSNTKYQINVYIYALNKYILFRS